MEDDDGASIVTRLLFSTALDLTAKAFAQPIGVEDNWDDLGDGIVEISAQNTLRVVRPVPNNNESNDMKTSLSSSSGSGSGGGGHLDLDGGHHQPPPDILIEDHISEEIPLVGKDCCIVWNSPTHDMSFCIMFNSECGYAAVWSAVHLLQGKSDIPNLGWDYLSSFRSMEESKNSKSEDGKQSKKRNNKKMSATGGEEPSRSSKLTSDGMMMDNNNNNNSDDMMGSMSIRPSQSEDALVVDVDSISSSSALGTLRETLSMSDRQRDCDDGDDGEGGGGGQQQKNSNNTMSCSNEKIAEAFAEAVRHVSSMSFVHRHCVAQSFIEGRYATSTGWGLLNAHVTQVLFSLFHPGLIFHFVDDDGAFERLAGVVSAEEEDAHRKQNITVANASKTVLKRWQVPAVLPETSNSLGLDIARALNRAMRLSALRHEMVIPGTEEGVLTFLETLQQQELHSVLSAVTDSQDFIRDLIHVIGDVDADAARVDSAIRCVADILLNAVTLLPREMMLPMYARIDDAGLIESLERMCSRVLENAFLPSSSSSSSSTSSPSPDTLKLVHAVGHLMESSVVCLNTRAEEGILGGLWRKPLLTYKTSSSSPTTTVLSPILKLLALWGRLTSSCSSSSSSSSSQQQQPQVPLGKSSKKNRSSSNNNLSGAGAVGSYTSGMHRGGTFFLYHLCGLHDDEGHTVDRTSDTGVVQVREAFQLHVATHVVPLMLHNNNNPKLLLAASSNASSSSSMMMMSSSRGGERSSPATAVVTSSELVFFESMLQWSNPATMRRMLVSLLGASSVLPGMLAATSVSSSPQQTQRLPTHVLCARARMVRAILVGLGKMETFNMEDLVASSSPPSSDLNTTQTGGDTSAKAANQHHHPHTPPPQNAAAVVHPLLMRITFDHDVMSPLLSTFEANRSVHRSPMIVSAITQLFQQIKNSQVLLPFKRYLRLRHGSALPQDFRTSIEEDELAMLRDEMQPEKYETSSQLSVASSMQNSGLMNTSKSATQHGSLKQQQDRSTNSPGSEPLPAFSSSGAGGGGMFGGISSGSNSLNLSGSGNSPDGISPSRRALLVDAEVPPPRSPEQLPLMKRRSPSPPTSEIVLTGGQQKPEGMAVGQHPHGRSVSGPPSASSPAGSSSHHRQQQQQHDMMNMANNNTNTNINNNNNGRAASSSSVIAADVLGATNANQQSSNNNNHNTMFRPIAPGQPRKPNQQNPRGGAPTTTTTTTSPMMTPTQMSEGSSNPVMGLAPRANSHGRPGSRGSSGSGSGSGRPRSGGPGGLRSRSPVTGLTTSSSARP